jgi:D-sedoheptulose 7-phosphate isomerase
MTFPDTKISTVAAYWAQYTNELQLGAQSLDPRNLDAAAGLITRAIERRTVIYVCGNGGSSAIASHLLCDFNKGIRTDTELLPRVVALTDNVPMLTAIGNDIGYDEIFSYQLSGLGNPSDLLIAISSSGDSENIVRALSIAKDIGMSTIAFTGFDGGRAKKIADVVVLYAAVTN